MCLYIYTYINKNDRQKKRTHARTDVDVALHELGCRALARDDGDARVGDAGLVRRGGALRGGRDEEELFVFVGFVW